MDSRTKKLILGYDLCNDYIQISCYNQKSQEMDSICHIGEKMLDRIPTVLCRLFGETPEWTCGYEAWRAVNEHRGVLVENFVKALDPKKEIVVDGDYYSSAELTRIYIVESLNLIKKYYPHWEIELLTITVEKLGKNTVEALLPLCGILGITAEQLKVINHVSAYEYYALNQPKELWQHDVGLFDYSNQGLSFYHLTISKKYHPIVAMAKKHTFKQILDGSEIGKMAPPELDRRFLEIVRKVTANKIISTVYLTGEGFEGDWAKISLKQLCHHRKGFIGSNIFSNGACYYSLSAAGVLTKDQFVALNEDVLLKNISIRGSRRHEMVEKELVRAGDVWYDVQVDTDLILDHMDHITIYFMDYLTKKEQYYRIPMTEFDLDETHSEKSRYIRMHVEFIDHDHCKIVVKDLGFGEFYPPSDHSIEKIIGIYEPGLYDREIQESGRLILTNHVTNNIPYHFGLSDIRVYSLEELCHYIYHHIYAVNEETFGEELIYWIEKNFEEKLLAKRLRDGKKAKRSLKDLVRILFNYVDYYTKEEIHELQKVIEEIERQNPVETKKVEADNYLRYGKALDALKCYKRVELMMELHEDMITREFKGDVYHNMAIAFSRLANRNAAIECFKKAYELNGSEDSRDSWLMMLKLSDQEDLMMDEINRLLLSPELVSKMQQKFNEAENEFMFRSEFELLERIKHMDPDLEWERMDSEIEEWLTTQKAEFRSK